MRQTIIRDSDQNGDRISDFGVNRKMAELIFLAYWNGNGNREYAAKWAIEFIKEHQDLCLKE